jgi:hypothetical protein
MGPWGHGFKSWKEPLAETRGNAAYIGPKVVGPFPGPCTSGGYVHRAALLKLYINGSFQQIAISPKGY